MSLKVRSIKQAGERWAKGMLRHGVETTRGPASMSNVRKVLWMVDPYLRTTNHHSKNTACITMPAHVRRDMGVERKDLVEWRKLRPGVWMVRKASAQKVRKAFSKFWFVRAWLEAGKLAS